MNTHARTHARARTHTLKVKKNPDRDLNSHLIIRPKLL